jgi:hypothetical protein
VARHRYEGCARATVMTMVMLRNEIVCECRIDSRPLRHVGTLGVARYRNEGCARATVMTMVMLCNEIVLTS